MYMDGLFYMKDLNTGQKFGYLKASANVSYLAHEIKYETIRSSQDISITY